MTSKYRDQNGVFTIYDWTEYVLQRTFNIIVLSIILNVKGVNGVFNWRWNKRMKKNMLKEVLNWKREGEGILVWPRSFLSWPTKTQSPPNWRENWRKNCEKLFGQKCPFKLTVCVRTCLSFLFLLKQLFLTGCGHGLCF